ncbi:hypothetical protein GCM10009737_08450 [Nocardioides lentus]|uniref:Uncharacterized protein n=1 Tax=Nocardioides lentus TaxID=338077 RepID=A0ABP5AHN3_9ACTN
MSTPVSPKVTASSLTAAATAVVLWLLTEIPFVDQAPPLVQASIALLVVGGPTFLVGYRRRDPLRLVVGQHRKP